MLDLKHHLWSFAISMTAWPRLFFVLAFLGLAASGPALAGVEFASHLAVYDIRLKKADPASGIADVTGRLVVELSGSDCQGWSVGFRMVSRFLNSEGDDPRLIDLQSTSWESDNGREMHYTQREFLNNTLNAESKLTANHTGKVVAVAVETLDQQVELPGEIVFPMTHQRRIIEAAKRGENMDRSVIYDGAEPDKYYTAVTFIGPELKAEPVAAMAGALSGLRSWRVSISYFDKAAETNGEDVPSHQISMRMFENGVSSDLVMDYGDLQLEGALSEFELLKNASCD
jgi:hypothetical protein